MPALGQRSEQVPAQPFIDWIEQQIAGEPEPDEAAQRVARRLGMPDRVLYRYRMGLHAGSRGGRKGEFKTDSFSRAGVENALHRAGAFLWEVYPPAEHPALYPDVTQDDDETHGWCARCVDAVPRDPDGRCLWCDTPTDRTPDLDWDRVIAVLAGAWRVRGAA